MLAAAGHAYDRMGLFLTLDAKSACTSFNSHTGHKSRLDKAVRQAAESAGKVPCPQMTAVLDDAILAFENKCDDLEVAIEHSV